MVPEEVIDEYEHVRGSDFLVARRSPVIAFGGELPFDVLLIIGFDGITSPLLDVRFMARWDTEEPVTSTRIRQVPIDQLAQEAIRNHRLVFREVQPGHLQVVLEQDRRVAYLAAMDSDRYASRRRILDADLLSVAEAYRVAVAESKPPTAAVEQQLGLPNRNVAKKWVQRARSAGFLEPAPGPRRGGVQR
jgi:hypothetical protein